MLRKPKPKTYRIYFNRKSEWPHVWSIDEGTQVSEILVQWVRFEDSSDITSIYEPVEELQRNINPCAWFQVTGYAEFTKGGVIIKGYHENKQAKYQNH